jgi:ubiquinone biosynthesis accessory factor UbiJ
MNTDFGGVKFPVRFGRNATHPRASVWLTGCGPRVWAAAAPVTTARPFAAEWARPRLNMRAVTGPAPAYNAHMLESLQSLVTPAVMQRLTLLLNHVLSSEAVATAKLQPHSGRRVQLNVVDWPTVFPALPTLVFFITPAGLLEWQPVSVSSPTDVLPDLTISIQASNPAQLLLQALSGQRPRIDVSGDAALAGDISWLMDNLRWDIQDDIARWLGQGPAHQLGVWANGAKEALAALAQRWRGNGASSDTSPPPSPP